MYTVRTLTLIVDYENNGERFWAALSALDDNHPALARWPGLRELRHGSADTVTIDASDTDTVEALPAFLASLPGWDDGDTRAPHPLVVEINVDVAEEGETWGAGDVPADGWEPLQVVGHQDGETLLSTFPEANVAYGVIGYGDSWSVIDADGHQPDGPSRSLTDAIRAAEGRNEQEEDSETGFESAFEEDDEDEEVYEINFDDEDEDSEDEFFGLYFDDEELDFRD